MKKVEQNKVALRVNISAEADHQVEVLKSMFRIEGVKLTKEATVDFMLKNFVRPKKKK